MKKKTVVLTVVLALLVIAVVSVGAHGVGMAVGANVYAASRDDSTVLVSLDWIENVLKPWIKEQTAGSDGAYTIVYLTKGQRLMAEDTLELVVRSGSVNAVSPTATQGLSDMTAGAEILNGSRVPVNHQVMIPRGDGRGIIITSSESYVMVRGPYTVE